MTHIQVSIKVDRPLDDVWDQVSRLQDHANWMMDVESIAFSDDRTSGVETTMRVLTRIGPFTTTDVIVVEEWNEPTSITRIAQRGIEDTPVMGGYQPWSAGTLCALGPRVEFDLGGPIVTRCVDAGVSVCLTADQTGRS